MGNYVNQADVEARLSADVVRRVLDDNNDGLADESPLSRVIADAEAWFESVAICVYPELETLRADGGIVAQTMVLDCVEALAARRFPRAFNRDWTALWDYTDKQLMRMRKGDIKLPVHGSPNPTANSGGRVELHGPAEVATDNEPVFTGGTGLF